MDFRLSWFRADMSDLDGPDDAISSRGDAIPPNRTRGGLPSSIDSSAPTTGGGGGRGGCSPTVRTSSRSPVNRSRTPILRTNNLTLGMWETQWVEIIQKTGVDAELVGGDLGSPDLARWKGFLAPDIPMDIFDLPPEHLTKEKSLAGYPAARVEMGTCPRVLQAVRMEYPTVNSSDDDDLATIVRLHLGSAHSCLACPRLIGLCGFHLFWSDSITSS